MHLRRQARQGRRAPGAPPASAPAASPGWMYPRRPAPCPAPCGRCLPPPWPRGTLRGAAGRPPACPCPHCRAHRAPAGGRCAFAPVCAAGYHSSAACVQASCRAAASFSRKLSCQRAARDCAPSCAACRWPQSFPRPAKSVSGSAVRVQARRQRQPCAQRPGKAQLVAELPCICRRGHAQCPCQRLRGLPQFLQRRQCRRAGFGERFAQCGRAGVPAHQAQCVPGGVPHLARRGHEMPGELFPLQEPLAAERGDGFGGQRRKGGRLPDRPVKAGEGG